MKLFNFLKEKDLVSWNFLNIFLWWQVLWDAKIIQFILVGGSGVLLQLGSTFLLTKYIFGLDLYYLGYSIGLILNLIYNFLMHTFFTFKSKSGHSKRFFLFIVYSLSMALFQYVFVRIIVSLIGNELYLLVISLTVLISSLITFLIFKFWLFKD